MKDVSIVCPDGGEQIELGPARMRLLEDGSVTAHRLGVGEITLAPHSAGPPQHRHAEHDEGFYVLSGTARFIVGNTSHDAPLTPEATAEVMGRYATTPAADFA
jgi:mannose-6-phosphate isomerase-like protein (cupin superfamily)